MSDFGTINLDRGLFDHPAFPDEPYTMREAWIWMIAAAAKRTKVRRVGHAQVEVAVGQLAYSHRFLAKRWQWSIAKVQRFLTRLVTELMIESVTESGVTRITLCNYSKYNTVPQFLESAAESPPSQIGQNQTSDSELVVEGDARARARKTSEISEQAHHLANEIMRTFGIDLEFIPPGWYGAPMWIQAGLNSGWNAEIVRVAAAKIRARKNFQPPYSFKYLARPIQREHEIAAEPHLPMPPVVVSKGQETASVSKTSSTQGWQQSRDRWRHTIHSLQETLDDASPESGDETGGEVVRFTPAAGRR